MKSSAYTPSIENPLFLQENLIPPSMTVQKPQSPPSKNKGGSHYTCLNQNFLFTRSEMSILL